MKVCIAGILKVFSILFLIAISDARLSAKVSPLQSQPAWDDKLDFEEIEHRLKTEAIVEKKDMRSFLKKIGKETRFMHPVKLVVLESGLKAVLKKDGAAYGEVGAYKAAKALGLRLVPPTVLREQNGKKVSLQFFVESRIDLIRAGHGIFKKLSSKDASDMNIFNFLLNRWDSHSGNQLMSVHNGHYYIALIDNAGSTFLSHKPRLKTRKIYGSTYLALKKLTQERLEEVWSEYLPVRNQRAREVIQRILQRKEQLTRTIDAKGKVIKDTIELDDDIAADE